MSSLANSRETLTRRSLELIAIAAYRKGTIGAGEVGQLLSFTSRWDTDNFLEQEQAEPPYNAAHLEQEQTTLNRLLSYCVIPLRFAY